MSTLLEWADAVKGWHETVISETLVLSADEKRQLLSARQTITTTAETIRTTTVATDNTAAEQTLRKTFADNKAVIQKLGDGVGKGLLVKLGLVDLLKNLTDKLKDPKKNAPQIKELSAGLFKELDAYIAENPELSDEFKTSMYSLFKDLQAQSMLASNDERTDPERQQAAQLAIAQATAATWTQDLFNQLIAYARRMRPSEACWKQAQQRAVGDFWERLTDEKRISKPMQQMLDQMPLYIMAKLAFMPVNVALSVASGVVEMGRCVTGREPTAGYWPNFRLGFANGLISQVDIFSLDLQLTDPDLIKMVTTMVVTSYECHRKLPTTLAVTANIPASDGSWQSVERQLLNPLFECGLGISYAQYKTLVEELYTYLRANYKDGYLHGQVFGYALTILLSTKQFPKLVKYLTPKRAMAGMQVATAGLDAKALQELLAAAEMGVDEFIEAIRKLRNRGGTNLISTTIKRLVKIFLILLKSS